MKLTNFVRLLLLIILSWFCGAFAQSKQIHLKQADLPYTIRQGSAVYYLDEDVNGQGLTFAISIEADSVVLDGQGHSIQLWQNGKAITNTGDGKLRNIEIKNLILNTGSQYGSSLFLTSIVRLSVYNNKIASAIIMNTDSSFIHHNELSGSIGAYSLDISNAREMVIRGNRSLSPMVWTQIFSSKKIYFDGNVTSLWIEDSDSVYGQGNLIDRLVQIKSTNVNVSSVTSVIEENFLSKKFSLEQNYPNPFNPTTEIAYQLPKISHVDISIYNGMGQKIATLVNKTQAAGTYQILWNGKSEAGESLPSGSYFYKFTAGKFTAVKKMLLSK